MPDTVTTTEPGVGPGWAQPPLPMTGCEQPPSSAEPVSFRPSAAAPAVDADPMSLTVTGDARSLPVAASTVDLIVTSPPFWRKRDYGMPDQIGQERTPDEYIGSLARCLTEWARVLRPAGSAFVNIGDSYHRRELVGIPARFETAARGQGWKLRNRIVWTKNTGMPDPAQNRLAPRHEYVLHLVLDHGYYYDLYGYANEVGSGANPGDVWRFPPVRRGGPHIAPYPDELPRRAIILGCPPAVCAACGEPRRRIVERTCTLDLSRPQARRAHTLAAEAGLTEQHIRAIQATGLSDVGKNKLIQPGSGRNTPAVAALAAEAKQALRGYYREFLHTLREPAGWTDCGCGQGHNPGVVLDPFVGSGTTTRAAAALRRSVIGVDLAPG